MPKIIARPIKETYTPPQRTPTVYAPEPRKSKVKIPDLVLGESQVFPETVGFSCRVFNGGWAITDRFSNVLSEQPVFKEYEVARAYADALNEEITRRRLS